MYVQTVEELMTGVTGIDFVQPWYTCVSTSKSNTGMALGGIGSAITATPAGTTPFFHFYNGCGIENEGEKAIELNNFFYGECVSSDLNLDVRSPSFFREDILAFPLFNHQGKKYFDGTEPEHDWKKILTKMLNCPNFISDNLESLTKWGYIDAEKQGTLYHPYKDKDFRYRNFAFILNIFAFSVTRKIDFTRSLIGDITQKIRLFKEAYPANKMLYEFQYPLSMTHYKDETQRCTLKKVHITPICPANEMLSSMPIYTTAFHVGNPTNEHMDVTIVLSVENFIGYNLIKTRTGVQDALLHIQRSFKEQRAESFSSTIADKKVTGMVYRQNESARKGDISGELCFAVLTRDADEILVTQKLNYYLDSESNVVDAGVATGKIFNDIDQAVAFSQKEPLCSAICISLRIDPWETKSFEMVTVIDLPDVQLGEYSAQKKYTEFFPFPHYRSKAIAEYFLSHREEVYVNEWVLRESTHHKATLESGLLSPSSIKKLRQILMDNLSFLAESSVWDTNNRFLVRECVDYPFFNSLDVYFYGSFGLLKLFPEADNRIVREFAQSILSEDTTKKLFGTFVRFRDERITHSLKGIRKVLGSTPHDMGTPFDLGANAYSWKDVASWVDLAPKFVLLVYRNFLTTRDMSLLEDTWPAVKAAIEYIKVNFIPDESDLPISLGYANTFDNLRGDGVCIYAASLWLASLTAAAEIAKTLDDKASETIYLNDLQIGKQQMQLSLWDEVGQTYLYSVVPLGKVHVEQLTFDKFQQDLKSPIYLMLKQLGVEEYTQANCAELTLKNLLAHFNEFVDTDEITLPQQAWQILTASETTKSIIWTDLSKLEKRAYKKRFLNAQLGGLFVADFEAQAIEPECEYIFANQLCADTYLYYFGLPMLTNQSQREKILGTILAKNMKASTRRMGASNMVARDGSDLDSFQGQDVWLGVQYSIAGALIATGMIDEFQVLTETLFDAIYDKAKIPFGIPEGFNCVGLFIAEDFIRLGIEDKDIRADIVKYLQKKKVVLSGNRVNFEMLEETDEFTEIWEDPANPFQKLLEGEDVYELLLATQLKYTAGRYFRAGMVHIIPEILRRYKSSVDGQFDEEEALYLALVRQAKAGFAVSASAGEFSYAD